MSNFTIDDYKNAIKAKYKEEAEGEYSNYLSSPTPAKLRKLCVKRFKSNTDREDLHGFESFFDFPFDKDKKNLFGDDEMNKLEAVKRFLLGRTEKPNDDTIQLAAILVDLRPRPFNEFRKQIDPENAKLIEELRGSPSSINDFFSDNHSDEVENDNTANAKNEIREQEEIQSEQPETTSIDISIPINTKSTRVNYLAIGAFFTGLVIFICLIIPKKECMQWSNDHYEMVSCDLKVNGYLNNSGIMPYDARYFDLKRIKVCDTTTFFKNGNPIVWYIKIRDSVQCYDRFAPYPEENSKYLRPITQYMIDTHSLGK